MLSQLSSGDASDSICPKGWGIAKYKDDKSYQKLIVNICGMNKANITLTVDANYQEYYKNISPDNLALQFSHSFTSSGNYNYTLGTRNTRTSNGYFWESKTNLDAITYSLRFNSSGLRPQYNVIEGNGFSVRCVTKVFCFIKHFCYFSLSKPRECIRKTLYPFF